MRTITILALLICWTAAEASSNAAEVKMEGGGWYVEKDGKLVPDSEHLAQLFHKAPVALLNAESRPPAHVHEILEDMRVMTSALGELIADAFLDNQHIRHVMIRSYYLGSGCLFLADMPFDVAGAETQSADQPSDEAWDAARRKLGYAPRAAVPPDRAERLKETLQSALALAKNIRHFKTDDFIAIAAVGSTRPPAKSILTARAAFKDLSAVQFMSEWTGNPSTQGDSAAMGRVIDKLLRAKLGSRFSGGPMEVSVEDGLTVITSSTLHVPVGEGVRSLYLKGYGALFFTDVHYPVGAKDADNELPADLWQESLSELRSGSHTYPDFGSRHLDRNTIPTAHEAVFLRSVTVDTILEALRYGSRIGGMDPDEALIVSVRGYDGSNLVFRTLKRHVDAYGAGALDINAFREKVSIKIDMLSLSWEELAQSLAPPVEPLTLTINEDGSMALDGEAATMEQLKERFNSAPAEKKKSLIIRSSPNVRHDQIVEAMELANQADIQNIGFAIEARKPNVTKGEEK